MKENQVKIIMILTVTSLILIFIGLSYAYFSAFNNQGSTAQATIDTGKMLITYNDGTDNLVPVTGIQPSDTILVNKTFSLTGTNTATGVTGSDGINMPYKVGLKYTSTFSDGQIHYYIKEVNRPASSNVTVEYTGTTNQTVQGNSTYTGYSHGTLQNGSNKYTEMVTGEFPASTSNQKITFNLILQFPDTGENQDSEKGATINGKIMVNYDNSISTYLTKLELIENDLEIDDTADKNLRYVGTSPKNYITFNGEIWRIIGVFNNITTIDEEGNERIESLVKIIRNDSLGYYSWDSSESSINSGQGINEWSQADLMTELNIDYIDTSKTNGTTTWYDEKNNTKTATYDYSNNIKNNSIDKIATIRWNLGGRYLSLDVLESYIQERGTLHVTNPSDGVTRSDYWDGKIALIYPSDYGFASTDTACRNNLNSGSCKNNNWLFNNNYQWTLSPNSGYERYAFSASGSVSNSTLSNKYSVRPTLFLKSDVKINGGTGTETDPYRIMDDYSFKYDSWETINEVVKDGQLDAYAVGSEKEVEIDGNSYTVRVANNSTPEECNGDDFSETACGFVVEFVDILEMKQMNSISTNVGSWPASELRTYANGDFFKKLPSDLQSSIIDTKVITGHKSNDTANFISTDKIYLLSGHEVYEDGTSDKISRYDTAYNNTKQLDYYKNQGLTTSSYSSVYATAIKKTLTSSSGSSWWLRTPYPYTGYTFLYVKETGSNYSTSADSIGGFAPAFRIG